VFKLILKDIIEKKNQFKKFIKVKNIKIKMMKIKFNRKKTERERNHEKKSILKII
jgi:hypothetical protein